MIQLKFVLGILILSLGVTLSAQMTIDGETVWGNEWIDYDKDYYKFLINESGVYKITGSELAATGINLSTFTGANIQIYNVGKQIPIYVSTDGNLGPEDYILFEGNRNDGELDKQLYGEVTNNDWEVMQFNPKYSLFSDNSAYYFTWDNTVENERVALVENIVDENASIEAYYMHTEEAVFNEFFIKRTHNGDDKIRLSDFDQNEGFGSFLKNKTTITLPTSRRYDGGINASVEIRLASNNTAHELEVLVNDELINQAVFSGYKVRQINETIDFDLINQNNNVKVVVDGVPNQDKYSVAYANLTYPRKTEFNDSEYVSFSVAANNQNRRYSIKDFTSLNEPLYVIDFESRIMKSVPKVSNYRNFEVEGQASDKKVHLVTDLGFKSVGTIQNKTFRDFTQLNPQYVIVTSEKLLNETYEGKNMVQEYVDYRSSEKGGSYDVLVISSEELVDQFSYGIERNPLSGHNWNNYILPTWTNWEMLFTIGKGVEYSVRRSDEQLNNPQIPYSHVPTWGVPGSDNMMYGKRGQTAPNVSLGRIATRNAEDIDTYLKKVKSHESVLDEGYDSQEVAWTKKIMHLSGGDVDIQNQIFNWLNEMKLIIEKDMFGADVLTFRKSSTDLLQAADSENILNTINNGVSIITFFGHSAVGTFDFSLEAASEYENKDKYPLLVSLGCHSGNIFAGGTERGLSEEFVFEKEKGSIAFLASTSTAYIGPQFQTGSTLYGNLSSEFYGKPLGHALKTYFDNNAENQAISIRSLNQQMTYHGDPAISLQAFETPDYLVDVKSIRLNPNVITTSDESFDLSFDVLNTGKSITETILVNISHTLPDGQIFEFSEEIPAPKYKENVQLTIPNPGLDALGRNLLNITVDYSDKVVELPEGAGEANNTLSTILDSDGFEFFIESNIAKPVSPSEFSIVTEDNLTLIAATTNLFSDSTEYILQIDTSELFVSPLQTDFVNKITGGKIEWKPDLAFEDESVYYWRVSPNFADSSYIWRSSSFVYLPEKSPGWNQSHFYQYLKDDFEKLELPNHNQLEFDTNGFFISLHNYVFNASTPPFYQFNFETSASSVKPWNFMNDGGVAIVIGDEIDGSAWPNDNTGEYGSIISSSASQTGRVFGFLTETPEQRKNVVDFMTDVIPDGAYVWFMSIFKFDTNDLHVEEWRADSLIYGSSIFHALEEQNAGLTNEFEQYGNVPYNFSYQKGVSALGEDVGTTIYDNLNTTTFVPIKDTHGNFTSSKIGPAVSWSHMEWDVEEITINDTVRVSIIGIEASGNETVLAELTNPSSYDLSEISASVFPYLKLNYYTSDYTERDATDLKHWRVFFEEYPEAVFNPSSGFTFDSDTLTQGDFLRFSANVENITSTPMDDLLVHYSIINEDNEEIFNSKFEDKIPANGNIDISFNYPTSTLKGSYQFIVEFNPEFAQREQFIFNNLGLREFFVKGSTLNPDLDVTFDNKRIYDGDIVSPNPEIVISLTDKNKFLLNTDPENFQQALFYPDGNRVDFKMPDPVLEFVPGTLENDNVARMYLRPTDLEPGEYTFIAQAKNAAGIFSGDQAFSVTFRVLSNSCVTEFQSYPNPFADITKISYTMTGLNTPESMEIDIFNTAGKIVKQVRQEDLINTGIGSRRLLFEWDGTAEDGSQVANGIYFYRLVLNDSTNNNAFRNCGSELDSKMHGRMVLMR